MIEGHKQQVGQEKALETMQPHSCSLQLCLQEQKSGYNLLVHQQEIVKYTVAYPQNGIGDWLSTLLHVCTMECYAAVLKNEDVTM